MLLFWFLNVMLNLFPLYIYIFLFCNAKCNRFDAVIHFAGLKAVGESVAYPFRYFDNNLIGSINLYTIMEKYNCKKVCLF